MSNKKTIIILAIGISFLLAHFVLLGFYILKPTGPAVMYSYPFFHQNWNLFVPPPTCNYNLYVYVPEKNANLKYTDVFGEIVEKHQKNRLKGYEPLIIGLSNCIHYFEKEAEGKNFAGGKVENNINFDIMEKFVKNYMKSMNNENVTGLKMILCVNPINKSAQRVYFN